MRNNDDSVMYSKCGKYADETICPTDGPSYDASVPGEGTHQRSNNALWSCFNTNLEILPYELIRRTSWNLICRSRCLATDFDCGLNPHSPDCTEVCSMTLLVNHT